MAGRVLNGGAVASPNPYRVDDGEYVCEAAGFLKSFVCLFYIRAGNSQLSTGEPDPSRKRDSLPS